MLRRLVVALGSVALVGSFFSIYAGSSSASPSPAIAAPFNECPAIGQAAGCEFLIILNPGGSANVVQDSKVGTFDGHDDTLVGVYNNSGAAVSTVGLSSSADIFGFDGDGICATNSTTHHHVTTITPVYTWTYGVNDINVGNESGCPYGSTGYEGPTVSFSNYLSNPKKGDVNFSGGGLTIGGTTFFSLEGNLSSASFTVPTTTTTSTTTTTTSTSTTTTVPATTTTTSTTTTVPATTTTTSTTTTVPATTTTTSTTTTVPATTTTVASTTSTTTTVPATTTTVASTTSTAPSTTTTVAPTTSTPPPPPPNNSTTTTAPPETSTTAAPTTTTTTTPPISTTTVVATPPTSPATTAPNLPPATVPSGAPGTGVGGAATSSDNGVLLTASGMALFAGLAGLVLIARRRRHA